MHNNMKFTSYKPRPVKFLEVLEYNGWHVKVYSISAKKQIVDTSIIENAKKHLSSWLSNNLDYQHRNYKIATLILHEGSYGIYAIINWWSDEDMLQLYVYFADYDNPKKFTLFSDKGMVTCVWEMAVLWHERNAWVKHVLQKSTSPEIDKYLNEQMNEDV